MSSRSGQRTIHKYVFELPPEMKGVDAYLDQSKLYVVYAASQKEAEKFMNQQILEEHDVRIKSKPKLIRRNGW